MKFVSVAEMVNIEKKADAIGHSYSNMMACAGKNLADWVKELLGDDLGKGVLGLVGKGNNGGDTLVALGHLENEGIKTSAYILQGRLPEDPLIAAYKETGGQVYYNTDEQNYSSLAELLGKHGVLLDGLLGTGIKLPLRGVVSSVLAFVKEYVGTQPDGKKIVAVDCPSGVDCDTGRTAEETLPADITVTMAAAKVGLFAFPAYKFVGKLVLAEIGLPETLESWVSIKRFVVDRSFVLQILPSRPLDSHKGTFGTAMIAAGSINYTGALFLAGKAAYRSGAGLVKLAAPMSLYGALAGHIPEATWLILPSEGGVIASGGAKVILDNLGRVTALLIGPGLGLETPTLNFLEHLLLQQETNSTIGFVSSGKDVKSRRSVNLPPVVVDADGLKLLAKLENWAQQLPPGSILTPHPGEMSALTGLPTDSIQMDRVGVAEKYAAAWGHVVVLKGACTVIANPEGNTAIIPVATPALARAGTGDVLAGIIVGLRAQGIGAFESASAGAWLHAQAGLEAAKTMGSTTAVLAGDVLDGLNRVLAF